ncbi:S-layer homology domain-containing protein [Paenibacillus thermotolerans]|uniref:S-layer homology domain-containing protein n=1 Tax=Paenibacillus thermotolerans TaxID=3027807 RepID=UPI002367D994|nr:MULTISPECIES: S-layer homology domain-containing protein [unclassified Paenibacillus]
MRAAAGKVLTGIIAFLTVLFLLGPMPRTDAAQITRASIQDIVTRSTVSFLVAGKMYDVKFESDKAYSTSIENVKLEYSTDGGATWADIPLPRVVNGFWSSAFSLPIDPNLTSALLRFSMYFDPIIGSRTYSEKILGPYKVLQPVGPSDFTAASNDDGTVTLRWNDNTNMESFYQITRAGPDGYKTFNVPGTMDHFGPLSYTDKQTNTSKSTIYIYSLMPVVDRYDLPEDLLPGTVWASVKTKVPLKVTDKYKVDQQIVIPELITPSDKNKLELDNTIIESGVLKYLEDFNLKLGDLDKTAVSGIKLDQTSLVLKTGESQTLIANVTPADAANINVAWSSDNSQVAQVDSSGKVTGKSPGIAKITATTEVGHFTSVSIVTVLADPPPPVAPLPVFKDLAGHPASPEIAKAVAIGVVSGYPDGTFRPDGSVTRAEFATMLMRRIFAGDDGATLDFKDKDKIGDWAVEPVKKAVKLGIIKGYDDGTFRPNGNITHAEMISMVIRASGLPTKDAPEKTGFADDADIPKWAKPAASKAEETGIIIVGGLPEGKFAPQALTTRAEAATAIVRMLEIPK